MSETYDESDLLPNPKPKTTSNQMSESINIKGPVEHIGEVQEFASGFVKQLIVVTVDADDKYPQSIPVEFVKDKIDLIKKAQKGDIVEITANLRGNEHDGRWYLSLGGWKLEVTVKHSANGGDIEEGVPPLDSIF